MLPQIGSGAVTRAAPDGSGDSVDLGKLLGETLVVDNAANPEWNEEFLFAVPPHPAPLCSLLSTERHSMPTLSCSAPTAPFPALSS